MKALWVAVPSYLAGEFLSDIPETIHKDKP
jgi:hypothetical protein